MHVFFTISLCETRFFDFNEALGQAQLGCYEGALRFRYSFIDCGSDLNLCVPLKDHICLVQYAFWIMKSIFSKIKMFFYRKKRLL